MIWKDVTKEHNGHRASVKAKSTQKSPVFGEGPFIGRIICLKDNHVPVLRTGDLVHTFAWYWEVELLEEINVRSNSRFTDIPDGMANP